MFGPAASSGAVTIRPRDIDMSNNGEEKQIEPAGGIDSSSPAPAAPLSMEISPDAGAPGISPRSLDLLETLAEAQAAPLRERMTLAA
jgi:hypothetical protein